MKDMIKIIVADESQETINELCNSLSKEKFCIVAQATDGISLLQTIREHKPHVVIMDLVLPQLDGFAVMEKLNNVGLQLPFTYKLQHELNKEGYTLDLVMSTKEMVKEICQLNTKK